MIEAKHLGTTWPNETWIGYQCFLGQVLNFRQFDISGFWKEKSISAWTGQRTWRSVAALRLQPIVKLEQVFVTQCCFCFAAVFICPVVVSFFLFVYRFTSATFKNLEQFCVTNCCCCVHSVQRKGTRRASSLEVETLLSPALFCSNPKASQRWEWYRTSLFLLFRVWRIDEKIIAVYIAMEVFHSWHILHV